MKKINVNFFIHGLHHFGGAERACSLIASKLVEHGYGVTIYVEDINAVNIKKKLHYYLDKNVKLEVFKYDSKSIRYATKGAVNIGFLLQDNNNKKLDIINNLHIAVRAEPYSKHRATGDQDFYYTEAINKKSKSVLSQTENIKKILEQNGVTRPITVIPNVVKQRTVLANLKNKKIYIASRIVDASNKNVLLALQAFDAIAHKYPDWSLDVYTNLPSLPNDEYSQMVSHFLTNCQSKEQINIIQANKELEEKIPEYSIYLNPSFSEGMSNSLCEAMSFGVPPVVLKECLSNSDIVEDGINGLTTASDIESYGNAIEKLIQNEDLRKKLGKNAKEKMKSFAEEKIINKWIDFIEKENEEKDAKKPYFDAFFEKMFKFYEFIGRKLIVIHYFYNGSDRIKSKIIQLRFILNQFIILELKQASRYILTFNKYLFFDSSLKLVILNLEIFKFVKNYRYRTLFLLKKQIFLINNSDKKDFAIDKKHIPLVYGEIFNASFDLKNPKLFTEKLNSLKLIYRKKYHTDLVNKVIFKDIVEKNLGSEYVIPTLGVYKTVKEFKHDLKNLPEEFIVKCNHVSGHVFHITNHSQVNHDLYYVLDCVLKMNYYSNALPECTNGALRQNEFFYKNIKPRIIVEKAINVGNRAKDFQIFASFGEVLFSRIVYDNGKGIELKDFQHLAFDKDKKIITDDLPLLYKNSEERSEFPEKYYSEMLKITKKLAHDLPFARIDFLLDKENFYIIETTLTPGNGFAQSPYHINLKYGQMIGDFSHLMPKI